LAHIELALLLQDNQQDDVGALCHNRSYMDHQPDSEKAPVARERLAVVQQRLGRQFGGGGGDGSPRPVSDAQIVARIEELNGEVAERDRTIQQLRDQIAVLTKENDRLGKEVKGLSERVRIMLDGGTAGSRTPSPELARRALDEAEARAPAYRPPVPTPPPIPPTARKYRVKRGDSLWSIAQKVYGDASRNRDIRNANRGRIGPNDKLTEGDDLVIPMP
jgi:nucleoid-associated protein YgaU